MIAENGAFYNGWKFRTKRPNFVKKAHCVQVEALIIEDFLVAFRAVTDKSIREKHPIKQLVHTGLTGPFQGPRIGQGGHQML